MSNFETASQSVEAQFTPEIIEKKAEQLLKDSGYEGFFPCPIEKIINYLGFKGYLFNPTKITKNICGILEHDNQKILLNSEITDAERFFTAAHEIGHAVLHPNTNHIDFRNSFNVKEPKEQEADFFALCLLMPAKEFRNQWTRFSGDIKKLSMFFGPSMSNVAKRAEYLKLG